MIVALTTSVNYADYLNETLPYTKRAVDRVIVITSPTDVTTHNVCAQHGVLCYCTNQFFRGGATFAKGSAINTALQHWKSQLLNSWILHLDADVVITEPIDTNSLAKDGLYGARRCYLKSKQQWRKFQRTGEANGRTMRNPYHRPIGFFQLWHGSHWKDYPSLSNDASWDDMEFIKLFDRDKLKLITQVYHLQTPDLTRKANWNGRTTQTF